MKTESGTIPCEGYGTIVPAYHVVDYGRAVGHEPDLVERVLAALRQVLG